MPQKTEGDPKWILASWEGKENFTEFFNMTKITMDIDAIACQFKRDTYRGRRKIRSRDRNATASGNYRIRRIYTKGSCTRRLFLPRVPTVSWSEKIVNLIRSKLILD